MTARPPTIELLPCPFCGGEPERDETLFSEHFITCKKCHASSPTITAIKDSVDRLLAEKWNTRAALAERQGLIEAARKAAEAFRWYEKLHAAKPDMEKAKRNAEYAEMLEAALEAQREGV